MGPGESCTIQVNNPPATVRVMSATTWKSSHTLIVGGTHISGRIGPSNLLVPAPTQIAWSSDYGTLQSSKHRWAWQLYRRCRDGWIPKDANQSCQSCPFGEVRIRGALGLERCAVGLTALPGRGTCTSPGLDFMMLIIVIIFSSEHGDMKLVRGSWLADPHNIKRFGRQQVLPREAF